MKYVFVSDIHGNMAWFDQVLHAFEEEKADKLIFLGDTASYEEPYHNQYMAEILNGMGSKVEVIRGNCDTYEFEEMLHFEMFDWDHLYVNGKVVTVTHGHYYNSEEIPPNCGEIFIQGHTHVPILQERQGRILANPGSVSRPRGVELRCYIMLDEDEICLKTLEGKVVKKIALI